MKLTSVENEAFLPNMDQGENLPLLLVSELLAIMLSAPGEEILVEGKSDDFLYDPGTGMEVGETLKATVNNETIIQGKGTVEITLSGTIEDIKGYRENCTLYFFMWWDHPQASPLTPVPLGDRHSGSVLIHPGHGAERLSESVFELAVHRKKQGRQREYLGLGRGYLVFGHKN